MKEYYPGNLGGNDKRYIRPQRGYDSPLTKDMSGNQRRNGFHRKKSGPDINTEAFNEALKIIKERLQHISDTQDRMAELQERSLIAEERQADAMERVAACVTQLLDASSATETKADISDNTRQTKEAGNIQGPSAFETIKTMRDSGATFGKIADHLNGEGIPTLSGADLWNRVSVSKYYKEAVGQ